MNRSSVASHLRVEVKHRCAAPKRYTWEIFSEGKILPVEESTDQFRSWEEASQAGKKALAEIYQQILSHTHHGTPWFLIANSATVASARSKRNTASRFSSATTMSTKPSRG